MLQFDPNQKGPPPRDAATVLVVRDGAGGLEAFCVRRHAKSGFLGGAIVFPGGKLDASDARDGWAGRLRGEVHARLVRVANDAAHARALAVAACRETFEEALLAPFASTVAPSAMDTLAARAKAIGLLEALEEHDLALDVGALVPFARWVTPEAEARRFDARFFLLAAPPGQEGRHDDHETVQSFWARPTDVLERAAKGELFLAPPTSRSLELLVDARDVARALAIAERQSLAPICPRFVAADPPFLALPGDPEHELGERRVDGPTRYVLRDGRFVAEDPPVRGAS